MGKTLSSLLLLIITLAGMPIAKLPVQTSEPIYEFRSFKMADSLSSQTIEPPIIEWNRTYGTPEYDDRAFSVVQTSGGEYILGGNGFANLMKTDCRGNQLWNRSYEGGGWVRSLVQTSEGGYALAGRITPSGDDRSDFWLVKTDTDGNMLWNKTYGTYAVRDDASSLVQTSDGGYAIAGVTGMATTDFWLVKTDTEGNMQWNKTYHRSNHDWANSIIKTDDGGYAIAGSADPILGNPSHGSDLWLVKTDENGNEEWNKTMGGTGYDIAFCVVQTNDEGYALAGATASPYGVSLDFWLVKTDPLGNIQWEQKYGGTQLEEAVSMVQTLDGGYALAGYVDYGSGLTDAYLVKTDSSGSMEWNQTYGKEAGGDKANCIVQTGDGGYAIAGTMHSTQDFWLMKLRSKGVYFWNSGWDFELGEFDTGDVYPTEPYTCVPWGGDYWGARGYTWKMGQGLFPIHYCRFHSDGHVGYLYGWEEYGEWGVVTYVQGDTWNIDPPWNCPQPLATDLKDLTISIDLWRDVSTGYNDTHDRMMYAIDVWFESPDLWNDAANCPKRLVMDLVFFVDGAVNQVESYIDLDEDDGEPNPDACYHYQAKVYTEENPTPYRTWQSWTINLNEHIEEALITDWKYWDETLKEWVYVGPIANPDEVRASLTLCQLEFILEVKYAWAGCAVDNFYLAYTLLGDVDSDGVVDASDLSNLAEAYGSTPENPQGNPNCDVNEDGIVDILDLRILGKNYGENS